MPSTFSPINGYPCCVAVPTIKQSIVLYRQGIHAHHSNYGRGPNNIRIRPTTCTVMFSPVTTSHSPTIPSTGDGVTIGSPTASSGTAAISTRSSVRTPGHDVSPSSPGGSVPPGGGSEKGNTPPGSTSIAEPETGTMSQMGQQGHL